MLFDLWAANERRRTTPEYLQSIWTTDEDQLIFQMQRAGVSMKTKSLRPIVHRVLAGVEPVRVSRTRRQHSWFLLR
jgi:hypothetical protein